MCFCFDVDDDDDATVSGAAVVAWWLVLLLLLALLALLLVDGLPVSMRSSRPAAAIFDIFIVLSLSALQPNFTTLQKIKENNTDFWTNG